jgi:hypothetical protein
MREPLSLHHQILLMCCPVVVSDLGVPQTLHARGLKKVQRSNGRRSRGASQRRALIRRKLLATSVRRIVLGLLPETWLASPRPSKRCLIHAFFRFLETIISCLYNNMTQFQKFCKYTSENIQTIGFFFTFKHTIAPVLSTIISRHLH